MTEFKIVRIICKDDNTYYEIREFVNNKYISKSHIHRIDLNPLIGYAGILFTYLDNELI